MITIVIVIGISIVIVITIPPISVLPQHPDPENLAAAAWEDRKGSLL